MDLLGDESTLLARMKPKTRYNIRLAARKGVQVREGKIGDLELWQSLYLVTARRNGIFPHDPQFFRALALAGESDAKVRLLIAEKDDEALAAMFLSTSADGAAYLYGASSGENRQLMAPYALQWAAMLASKSEGCASYDLFGRGRPDPTPTTLCTGSLFSRAVSAARCFTARALGIILTTKAPTASYLARESAAVGFHL